MACYNHQDKTAPGHKDIRIQICEHVRRKAAHKAHAEPRQDQTWADSNLGRSVTSRVAMKELTKEHMEVEWVIWNHQNEKMKTDTFIRILHPCASNISCSAELVTRTCALGRWHSFVWLSEKFNAYQPIKTRLLTLLTAMQRNSVREGFNTSSMIQ